MAKPANPSIIIGLGGTGQWVLTYVKKNLLDTYGQIPPTTKLLSFDTTSDKVEAKVEKGEEHARVGNIQLEADEFIYLGGNIRNMVDEMLEGRHNHITSWFQAEYYRATMEDDAYSIAKGAGQRRPFGRMAVFYDLTKNPSDIIDKVGQAITDVKNANQKNQLIQFYVVCSLAGGTGSGMFIDIAHIIRKLAEDLQVTFEIRAFLVLQNTFGPVINIKSILANSFAATRELDRFLQVFDRDCPIYYSSDEAKRTPTSVYRSIYRSKLFDSCYLLDARRQNLPLDGYKPWHGVFPATAECITALLDSETGDTFDQHYRNTNNSLAQAQKDLGQALYSSLGAFTYILPVEDMIETAAHRATIELLRDYLFKISDDPRTGARKVTADNQVEFRDTPKEAVMAFLKSDKVASGQPNLAFFQQMAQVLSSGRMGDRAFVNDIGSRGLEMISWLMPVESDDVVDQISKSIDNIIQAVLGNDVVTSDIEKDDLHSAADRIARQVREFRESKLGFEEAGGRRVAGALHKGLAEFGHRNRRRFRRMLADTLLVILNGEHSSQIVSKSGKLPYAMEFVDWLIKSLDEFDGFMKSVVAERARSGLLGTAREDVIRVRQVMYDTRDLSGIFDRMKKTAVHAQEDYIRAEEYLFSLEREDALYSAVQDYAAMFRTIALDLSKQLKVWMEVLATGGTPESGERGAYEILSEQHKSLNGLRAQQREVKVYEYVTDETYENDLYKRLMNDNWADVLRRFKWDISLRHTDDEESTLNEVNIQYRHRWEKDREQDSLVKLAFGGNPLAHAKDYETPASTANARQLLDWLRPYFQEIRDEKLADRLRTFGTAQFHATRMLERTDALIQYPPERQPKREKRNYVCINRGTQTAYYTDLAEMLRQSASSDKDNQVIGLSNPHRCIVLSTVDMLIGRETAPIMDSRKAYMEHTGDHRLLHNFPSEVNASQFEDRIPKSPINEARRLLAPALVALLEDRTMLRLYAMARVFELLREERALGESNQNQFILRLDREQKRDLNSVIRLSSPSSAPNEMDVMTEFVFVQIDRQTGERYIKDIDPASNNRVPPKRVDDCIRIRQESILTGREMVVKEFDKLLHQDSTAALLNRDLPDARSILVGAFRRFMMNDYTDYLRETGLNAEAGGKFLTTRVAEFLDANRDCFASEADKEREERLHQELANRIIGQIKEHGPKIFPKPVGGIVRMLEDYIDRILIPKRKNAPDPLTRDYATVLHLVLWDEVERLERLRNSQ